MKNSKNIQNIIGSFLLLILILITLISIIKNTIQETQQNQTEIVLHIPLSSTNNFFEEEFSKALYSDSMLETFKSLLMLNDSEHKLLKKHKEYTNNLKVKYIQSHTNSKLIELRIKINTLNTDKIIENVKTSLVAKIKNVIGKQSTSNLISKSIYIVEVKKTNPYSVKSILTFVEMILLFFIIIIGFKRIEAE